jgi:hypothetical protein
MTDIERAAEVLRDLEAVNRRYEGDYFAGKAEAYKIAAEYLERVQGGKES